MVNKPNVPASSVGTPRQSAKARAPQRHTLAAALFAVCAAVAFLVVFYTKRFDSNRRSGTTSASATAPAAESARSRIAPPPRPGGDSSLSATPQRLVLVATRGGGTAGARVALIGVDPRYPQAYGIGALLANGARVAEIESDHVLLERHGASIRLEVHSETSTSKRSDLIQAGGLDSIGGTRSSAPAVAASSERVTDYLRPSPVFDTAGKFAGVDVQPGLEPERFHAWGLEPGDRIVGADGVPIADAEHAAQILQSVVEGATVTATVRRGSSSVAVVLDGASPTSAAAALRTP